MSDSDNVENEPLDYVIGFTVAGVLIFMFIGFVIYIVLEGKAYRPRHDVDNEISIV